MYRLGNLFTVHKESPKEKKRGSKAGAAAAAADPAAHSGKKPVGPTLDRPGEAKKARRRAKEQRKASKRSEDPQAQRRKQLAKINASHSDWVRSLAKKGNLLTMITNIKDQESIICMDNFDFKMSRVIVNLDSSGLFHIVRFFIMLSDQLTLDFFDLSSGSAGAGAAIMNSIEGDETDPALGEPICPQAGDSGMFPVPLFIQKFHLSRIKLQLSVKFTSNYESSLQSTHTDSEVLRAYEQITKKLVIFDIADTPLTLGSLSGTQGGITDISIEDQFMTKGLADLEGRIGSEILRALIVQSLIILGTPKFLGNWFQVLQALFNVLTIVILTLTAIKDVICKNG